MFINLDKLWDSYPSCTLEASGELVGLPKGQMGNSEVGHMTIGSGRVTYQPLVRINNAIESGTFDLNEELIKVMNHVNNNSSKLHLFGLLSDGGIHSHINHIFALIKMAISCKSASKKSFARAVLFMGLICITIGLVFVALTCDKIDYTVYMDKAMVIVNKIVGVVKRLI